MKLWFISKWDSLRGSFWFLPSLMVVAAIGLSLMMIHLDKAAETQRLVETLGWTFSRGPEGSRALLAMVAGSMLTIASVSFSITIVALQLASSQFGPRLLRNFMRDRGNQIAIGTFIATFTYCLLVLRTVNGTENEQFVPHMAVTVALLLALFSVGVFIFFIHHSAESIQAENVIAAVSRELLDAIDRLYPDGIGEESAEKTVEEIWKPPHDFDLNSRPIVSKESNYLQAINIDELLAIAKEHDLLLFIAQRPGKFCLKDDPVALASPCERVDGVLAERIRSEFFFGHRRTLVQDVEFAIDQLVEVAVRALSPGINDPFTAINCIDRLGAGLCALAKKRIPSENRYDDKGSLRVVARSSTIQGMIDDSFDQIRQAARSNTSVTLRLLEMIAAVAPQSRSPIFRQALRRQANGIHRGSQEQLPEAIDREDAAERFQEAVVALDDYKSTKATRSN